MTSCYPCHRRRTPSTIPVARLWTRSSARTFLVLIVVTARNTRLYAFSASPGPRPRPKIHPLALPKVPTIKGRSIRIRQSPLTFTTTGLTSTTSDDEFDGWKAGDVYQDLEQLERAITLDKADLNLQHTERMEMLQHFATARRPILSDISRYVMAPLVAALFFRVLAPPTAQSMNGVLHVPFVLVWSLAGIMNLHFWTAVVAAPILLLAAKRIVQQPSEPMPEELQKLDPAYLGFLSTVDYVPPERSCRDYVLFLLEYWTSAVATTAALGILQVLVAQPWSAVPWYCRLVEALSKATLGWMGVARLLTRVGVIAALYQNPKQVFQLRRPQQLRPKAFFPFFLERMISSMIWILPLGLATDLFQVLIGLPNDALISLYTSLSVLGIGTFIRLNDRRDEESEDGLAFAKLERLNLPKRWLYAISTIVLWKRPIGSWMQRHQISRTRLKEWNRLPLSRQTLSNLRPAFAQLLVWTTTGVLALVGPMLHLRSLAKIVRIVYTHDLSLALDAEDFREAMEDEASLKSRMKWRYRLEWREDRDTKRVGQVLRKWRKSLGYWLFLEGKVQEKLWQERKQSIKESLTTEEWNLKDRILDEIRDTNPGALDNDDGTWKVYLQNLPPLGQGKKNSMKRLAEKHQQDYDLKEFEDPLGVAVQQTLGIGLGFNFDHDIPLKKGTKPSLRRLQARAAKSAIRRIQLLYDSAAKELDDIPDPGVRKTKALEIGKRIEEERKFLASRMTELVPTTNGGSDEFKERVLMKRFQHKQEPQNFVRVSSHEFRATDGMEAVDSIERDLENFTNTVTSDDDDDDDDARGQQNHSSSRADAETDIAGPSDDNDSDAGVEDEFLDAYVKEQKSKLSGVDDDDEDTRIVLA